MLVAAAPDLVVKMKAGTAATIQVCFWLGLVVGSAVVAGESSRYFDVFQVALRYEKQRVPIDDETTADSGRPKERLA